MAMVLDCSVAAAFALADEQTPWTDAALRSVDMDGAIVPVLFWYEIRNVLLMNERRGRIHPAQTGQFLLDISMLIRPDAAPAEADILAISRDHRLSVYDACYMELARRLGEPLCTLDRELVAAAPLLGVRLWTP